MVQQEVIVFSADDKRLLESLARINAVLQKTKDTAGGVGDELGGAGKGAKGFDALTKSVSGSLGAVASFAAGVGNLVMDIGKLSAAMLGGLAAGFKVMNAGLNEIENSAKAALQIQYLKKNFGELSDIVGEASGGLIDYKEQLLIINKSRGIVSGPELSKLVELGTALGLVNSNFNETTATLQLLDTILTGNAKGLRDLSPQLYDIVKQNAKIVTLKDGTIDRQLLINLLTKKGLDDVKRASGILDSPFKKLMDMSNFIRKQGEDILGIFGGIAKIFGALAIPLGVGVAGFAFGGPFVGILGTIIGAAISGALLVGFTKLASSLAGKDSKQVQDEITATVDVWREILGGSLMQLLTGQGNYFLPDKDLERAGYKVPGKEITKDFYNEDYFSTLSGRSNGKPGIIQRIAKIIENIRQFIDGFAEAFDKLFPAIKESFNKLINNIGVSIGLSNNGTANDAGKIIGTGIFKLFNEILNVAGTLAGPGGPLNFMVDPAGAWKEQLNQMNESFKKRTSDFFDAFEKFLMEMADTTTSYTQQLKISRQSNLAAFETELASIKGTGANGEDVLDVTMPTGADVAERLSKKKGGGPIAGTPYTENASMAEAIKNLQKTIDNPNSTGNAILASIDRRLSIIQVQRKL